MRSVTRVNRNRKGTGVAIVPVNRAIGFPNAIRVTGRMIAVANEKNFRPEVFVQLMLVFEDGEIIAGGDHASVQHDQVIFARRENNGLLGPTTESDTGEENSGAIRTLTEQAIIHESGRGLNLLEL